VGEGRLHKETFSLNIESLQVDLALRVDLAGVMFGSHLRILSMVEI
jgi:hypothetical protein